MKLLILGSEGFIGGHCVSYFSLGNHDVSGIDLFEQPSKRYRYVKVSRLSTEFDELFSSHAFDAVINAAGSGNVNYSMTHPVLDFEANSLDVIRVLDAIRRHQPRCKYVHISSAAVYGNPERLPIHENDHVKPLSPYGWHKLISENICKEYSSVFKIKTAIVRPFSVYGPGLRKQMFWDVFQKVNSNSDTIELFGNGNESRDYVYISDLMQALNCVIQSAEMNGEAFNVASGVETKIGEAVKLFLTALKCSSKFKFNGDARAGDPLNWRADIGKIRNIGFSPSKSLDAGLSELSNWLSGQRTDR